MNVLVSNEWKEIPVDYAASANEYYVHVHAMVNIEKIDDAYFQRQKSWWLLYNYVREIGLFSTLAKVVSRMNETARNEKYLSVGFGSVQDGEQYRTVYFIAPFHPACADVVVCSRTLIMFAGEKTAPIADGIIHLGVDIGGQLIPDSSSIRGLGGWSPFSGVSLPAMDWKMIKEAVDKCLAGKKSAQTLKSPRSIRTEKPAEQQRGESRVGATLLGFGNYAKTVILPNLPRELSVTRIHEVDPLQLTPDTYAKYHCDSSPEISSADKNEVFFIAGFHHTHASLAIDALSRNACAVVEKPLVTTAEQLQNLVSAMEASNGKYFSCFHKRYLGFNHHVRQDLGIGNEDPINYHTVVYEVPLPKRHWYRWPNSCSRIVSNGCHWLDHFLYLNNFSEVESQAVFEAPDETINASVVLANGACFSMILTDVGSERLGVQDYIELRQNRTTIKMLNGGFYEAESSSRIVRRASCSRMDSYRRMYREIGNAIVGEKNGDSLASLETSARLTLSIEAELNEARSRRFASGSDIDPQKTQKQYKGQYGR
jgi:predicted dehydrogenase